MTCRVAYFANQFAAPQGHGLTRYALDLYQALIAHDGFDITPVAGWSGKSAEDLAESKRTTGLQVLPTGRRGTSLGWTFLNAPPVEWMLPGRTDVTHSVAMGYPVATRKPLVVTVHDLGPLTHPEYFTHNRPWVMQRALEQAVNKAAAIVCISEATANEVRDLYGDKVEDRLRVVHSGVSQHFFDAPDYSALENIALPGPDVPIILAAGALSPRKNIHGLLRALRLVLEDVPHHVVLTGGSGWDTDVISNELGDPKLTERVHLTGYISDAAVRALYHRADMYIHPSLFEGFGLTLLEAMASGTPVITSNCSSLPEIAGDAAVLVDPKDPESIAAGIVKLANDPDLCNRLCERGYKRAKSFSWEKTAEEMHEIYFEAANG